MEECTDLLPEHSLRIQFRSMDFLKCRYSQGFSYHSEVGTGGLLNLGEKFGPSKLAKN